IVSRPAVGISGAVLLDRTNEYFRRANHFGPTHCYREKMRISKRNIRDRNISPEQMRLWNLDFFVCERRAANSLQSFVSHRQPLVNTKAVTNAQKRLSLARLGPLTVADVQRSGLVIARCQRGTDARVHPSA